ncbi:hypothetical protein RFI_15921 [Reticulomyxa filosa]|uniref:Checkpoint protein n=1 Tax=Reticulomyxa filosa TaxID=46433 RepID=X6N5S8_RETFI|nr:hypothetical protein RFI_15921 [Reticulomyxa filosa]|eukprot:ETO21283.1 hypothetical protein RFI_15921 [Reticulomyxa filosa]
MTETDWKFYVSSKHASGNIPQMYGNIPVNTIFIRYIIQSNSQNEILLEIDVSQLLRVFQVCTKTEENVSEISLKLTTKNDIPLLAFAIWTDNNQTLLVSQEYGPPKLKAPNVQIRMPELRAFKTMLDKMQSVSDYALFKVSHDGKCEVEVDNDCAKIETVYQELSLESTNISIDHQRLVIAKVNIKQCIKVVQALQRLEASLIMLCLIQRKAITFYARTPNAGIVTFIIGVVLDDTIENDETETETEADIEEKKTSDQEKERDGDDTNENNNENEKRNSGLMELD